MPISDGKPDDSVDAAVVTGGVGSGSGSGSGFRSVSMFVLRPLLPTPPPPSLVLPMPAGVRPVVGCDIIFGLA